MSDTPRTDAAEVEDDRMDMTVSGHFARQLERELAAATARAEKAEEGERRLAAMLEPQRELERELANQREVNRLRVPGSCQCGDDDLCAIARERDDLRKDKERIDWLQTFTVRVDDVLRHFVCCDDVDIRASIDAAMRKDKL